MCKGVGEFSKNSSRFQLATQLIGPSTGEEASMSTFLIPFILFTSFIWWFGNSGR
ncbi:unnamed protein product [Meloidogyne enterolobii]|uniref:Uncharacterized protein n=1 Tax=Meloidogyne enterolobii TaxID=390850 RepID=A0ACB1AGH9_MELEN